MRVAVIANGEWDDSWGRSELEKWQIDLLIAADGGANHAIKSGIIPDVLVGDLDSITGENLADCQENNTEIKKYPREKNETDLELALDCAEGYLVRNGRPDDEILLFAAAGKRIDHLFGNIALMMGRAQKKRRIRMLDKDFEAWITLPGTETVPGTPGQEMSLIPLSESARVSSQGLYYELNNLTLRRDCARGISNVFRNDQADIEVQEGILLVVKLRK